eukprot:TRINITY_DN44880_c0_g1_i1.p1 TRINITY_DN44880_c0_g1~~TRINITY_DN44880_c0_g1_i1.p1  ORF type:complete len:288 (+),score=55.60 TRINITY_DN44880_c0_g1_i1:291-1154(+)
MSRSVLLNVAACLVARAFPVTELALSADQFSQLNTTTGSHDSLATSLILPKLEAFFKSAEAAIIIQPGDIVIKAKLPDQTIDDSCDHDIQALNGHCDGEIKSSTYLEAGVKLSWNSATVFVDAELDAALDVGGDVRVEIGKHVFGHHCTHLGRKTMGIDIASDGKNGVGINMTASNAHIEHVNGTWYLAFKFHADVVGRVIQWNVDKITADGCKIKILGIEILSVCGYVEKHVKDKVQTLLNTVTKVDAPKILQRLQDKINTAVGDEVRIPLKLPGDLRAAEVAVFV